MNRPAIDLDLDNVVSIDCRGVEYWEQPPQDLYTTVTFLRELLDEGVKEKDIVVLVRDANFAGSLKAKLDQAQINAQIVGGSERFYARLEVRDLANALRAVADPNDDFSLLACLRSPVVGLSLDAIVEIGRATKIAERLASLNLVQPQDTQRLNDFLIWYEPLRMKGDRLSAWEVLSEIFARSPYLFNLAKRPHRDQVLANVRKLLTLAIDEPEFGPLQFAERIREIQDIVHKEGDAPVMDDQASAVSLMTIHKAKGLEFPVVVLPQTDRSLESRKREVVVEPRLKLVATNFSKGESIMYRLLNDLKRKREEAEELRVLYVALTRAKNRLCIVKYPTTSKMTISKVLEKQLGKVPPPGVRVRTLEVPDENVES